MIPTKIQYRTGDATEPEGEGLKIIVHCCNDGGGWGAGFTEAISKKWKSPENRYRTWYAALHEDGISGLLPLGATQLVPVADDLVVCNLIGQHGVRGRLRPTPIRYHAIHTGLAIVSVWAKAHGGSVHMPRMGAGLAGGDWNRIEKIIEEELCRYGVKVTVYDLPKAEV